MFTIRLGTTMTFLGVLPSKARITPSLASVAMAEARDGICTVCHVRLRPQVFNTVRRNEAVIQCDSCQRILYFVTPVAAPAAETAS